MSIPVPCRLLTLLLLAGLISPAVAADPPITATMVGVRTEMAKVITYPGRSWPELFDLTNDPYDLANLAQSPARQALRARMRDGLDRVKHAVNFKIPTAADEVPPEAIDSWINKEPNQ